MMALRSLLVQSPETLLTLSSHWQDALIYARHMRHDSQTRSFFLLGVRVCREQSLSWRGLMRTRSVIHVRAVEQVRHRHIDITHTTPLTLLAVLYDASTPPACQLRFVFAGQAALLLQLEALDIWMKDEGVPWRSWRRPRHVL